MGTRFLIFIVLIVLMIILLVATIFLKHGINVLSKKEKWEIIDRSDFMLIVNRYTIGYDVQKGKMYAFHPISKTIRIEDKIQYTYLDLFKLLHELSHAQNTNREKKIIYFKNIYNFIVFPFCVYTILLDTFSYNTKCCIAIISILFSLIKACLVLYIVNVNK